ncbi:hypothetical protein [Cryptosporangium aurantiacum]|uniref:Uncharacterized protein n=1 Tax=Cryptosporangium aurantiacum TaxID=134849 RepID=A0A1M7QT76_9ACTN|nr:hypothetical protein [Cryptosporangium aurantiacum]SHN34755.1 hypothetical protein SAMN05443668_105303 [Cryptosporangium aurantiacum]
MIVEATDTVIEAANNFGDTREGAGAGPMALAVVALLAIATILLWRNMTARIKRLPTSFPDRPEGSTETKVESTTTETTAARTDAAAGPTGTDAGSTER